MIIVIIMDMGVKGIVKCMKGSMEFMTEKRYSFNVNKMTIEKDGKYFAYTTVEDSKIVDELNALHEENEQLKQQIGELQYSKKMLRATNKDLELGIHNLRKSFEELDTMRIKHIKFLQKRMKKYGISIYYNDDGDVE